MSTNAKTSSSLGVLLDRAAIDTDDIDFAELESIFDDWRAYDYTSVQQLQDRVANAVVVITSKVMLDETALRAAARLQFVCIAATGTNNIDLNAAKELGIPVSSVPGYATPAVTQHVFALILALTTRLMAYHEAVSRGRWQRSPLFCLMDYPIRELHGKTLGIVGYGELGRRVASIADAFGMKILIAQRPGGVAQAGRVPLDKLLPQVDVLSLHCPLTATTQGLIGVRELALMKRDAVLINTARGGIVDEQALADALRAGQLGGAGVDVLTAEPPVNGNPLLTADIPNLIVTPHSAWASRETRQRVVHEVAINVRAFLDGRPRNLV